MSIISKINNTISGIKNKVKLSPTQAQISQRNTMLQMFSRNDIQPQDFYEVGIEATESIGSQIQENLFEEENSNTKLNFVV